MCIRTTARRDKFPQYLVCQIASLQNIFDLAFRQTHLDSSVGTCR